MKTNTSTDQFVGKSIRRFGDHSRPNSVIGIIDINDSTDRQAALDAIDRFIGNPNGLHVVYVVKYLGEADENH